LDFLLHKIIVTVRQMQLILQFKMIINNQNQLIHYRNPLLIMIIISYNYDMYHDIDIDDEIDDDIDDDDDDDNDHDVDDHDDGDFRDDDDNGNDDNDD